MNSILFTCEKCGHENPSGVDPFIEWKNKVARLQADNQRLQLKLKTLENAIQEYWRDEDDQPKTPDSSASRPQRS